MADEELDAEQKAMALLDLDIQNAWNGLIEQPAGRLILWSILNKCGNFSFPHYGDSTDVLLRGRQQVGQELLEEFVLHRGMKYYTDMLLEAEARQERLDQAAEQTDRDNEEL